MGSRTLLKPHRQLLFVILFDLNFLFKRVKASKLTEQADTIIGDMISDEANFNQDVGGWAHGGTTITSFNRVSQGA